MEPSEPTPVAQQESEARAAIIGLSTASDRRHVVRAALESIAFQLRDVLQAMRQEAGVTLRSLHGDGVRADDRPFDHERPPDEPIRGTHQLHHFHFPSPGVER